MKISFYNTASFIYFVCSKNLDFFVNVCETTLKNNPVYQRNFMQRTRRVLRLAFEIGNRYPYWIQYILVPRLSIDIALY